VEVCCQPVNTLIFEMVTESTYPVNRPPNNLIVILQNAESCISTSVIGSQSSIIGSQGNVIGSQSSVIGYQAGIMGTEFRNNIVLNVNSPTQCRDLTCKLVQLFGKRRPRMT
jgi:hypothetical protein